FLRFAGQPSSTRFRDLRPWLTQMCAYAQKWSDAAENKGLTGKGLTKAYIDLLFAYALARLGEHDASNELRFRATEVLLEEPEPHNFLLKAFDHRIDEALHGRPTKGALPPQLMDDLDQVPRLERYAVDRMRSFSRILEPDTKLDPYRHWGARISDLDK